MKAVLKEKIIKVSYSVSARFSFSSVTINSEGNISYEGKSRIVEGGKKESDSGKITLKQFEELAKVINEIGFFSLKSRYSTSLCDGETETISVETEKKTKSVSCYGEYPEEFVKALDKIKELWPKPLLVVGN